MISYSLWACNAPKPLFLFHEAINRQMPIPEIKNKKGSTENMDVEVEEEE